MILDDNYFMRNALNEANKSLVSGEFPVGCVITYKNKIIARGHNKRICDNSRLSHAELNAISKCSEFLFQHEKKCNIYITLEPCMMCMGAIIACRIDNLFFAAQDKKAGFTKAVLNMDHYSSYSPSIKGDVLSFESNAMIREYFNKTKENWGDEYFNISE